MVKSKRAPLPYRSDYTKSFVKAWQRYNKAGRRDMHETAAILSLVLSGGPLPPQYNDHPLSGNLAGFRELHIGGDYLRVYRVDEAKHLVVFTDLGTHAELFE
ncbi:type II toxin-antitoxin system YafQ family toxin [Enterobacter sp. Bisph1]|uniref:type II toxin-antitoxin system RelE/ParE family toxin n=1 Tax=Enterobacter sp. Bisph1 TaxID=1274399 RepID=UPI00057C19B6|nr:type II toxin-antitoxin system YafQ family toxin [Enterobacter sp. Bisph1]